MNGLVAGGSAQSAEAGAAAFRAGGNACDAVLAAAFATSSGEAAITSLAGGGALVYRPAGGVVTVCDFFANAPGLDAGREANGALDGIDFHAIDVDFGPATQVFHVGRGAAAVPGAIPGLLAAWRRWGTLPLEAIVEPAVDFLRRGIALGAFQSYCIELLAAILRLSPLGRERFLDADGAPLRAGDRFRNPALADTLERIARHEPPEALYEREIAAATLDGFGAPRGGWITPRDLREWSPVFRESLEIVHCGARIATNPAPSVGGRFIALTLALMRRCGVASIENDAERLATLTAVLRAVSDARDVDPELLERENVLARLDERLLALRAEPPATSAGDALLPPRNAAPPPGNTVHLSAVDERGNAAGLTLSHGEGCGHEIGASGILMNNFLGEHDLFPAGLQRFRPGERLRTMMAPGIVVESDGAVTVIGSGGSNRIRTVLPQVLSAMLDRGLSIEEAIARPRVHFESGVLTAELLGLPGGRTDLELARALASRLECFDEPNIFFGGVNVARLGADGRLSGAADARRGGAVREARDVRSA